MSQNLQNFAIFQKFQLENLVDFEKCCQTHIFLQKSVPIQPKTSNILPKFCRSAVVSPTGDLDERSDDEDFGVETAGGAGPPGGGGARRAGRPGAAVRRRCTILASLSLDQ